MALFSRRHVLGLGVGALSAIRFRPALANDVGAKAHGLSAFGDEGDEFDPLLHEAVQHEGEGSHPIIGSVMRRGYKVGEQVVRHAMVGVVDTVPDEENTPENTGEPLAETAESDDD